MSGEDHCQRQRRTSRVVEDDEQRVDEQELDGVVELGEVAHARAELVVHEVELFVLLALPLLERRERGVYIGPSFASSLSSSSPAPGAPRTARPAARVSVVEELRNRSSRRAHLRRCTSEHAISSIQTKR